MTERSPAVSTQRISGSIHIARGQKVMVDRDLAELYGVSVKALNQAVRRNPDRFPEDFMFQLTWEEAGRLRSQTVTLNGKSASASRSRIVTLKRGANMKYLPLVFTEQGVAMLSSVLRSARAVVVNIEIMRAFVRLREALATNTELAKRIDQLEARIEKRLADQDHAIVEILQAIRQLMSPPATGPKRRIGFV
jgi:ATP-dependent Clp protease ATP-binding subunit ClpA